ncbi:hypothetical protein Unana1_04904 [Umbelopsis nana]
METLKRYIPIHHSKDDAVSKASIFKLNSAQLQEPSLLSYRYQPIKQRRQSTTVSTLISSDGSSSVPYTIIRQEKQAPPIVEFNMKELDSVLDTAFVLLSSCDKTLGHLPQRLKQTLVQKAQEDSKMMSNHVDNVAESGNARPRESIGSAQSLVHRIYSHTHSVQLSVSHVTNYSHSLSTWDLQQAVKNGATQVQTVDKRLSSATELTDSSDSSYSTVNSEPSSPIIPNHSMSFTIANESSGHHFLTSSPVFQSMETTVKDVMDVSVLPLPFTKARTTTISQAPSSARSKSSQDESWIYSKRTTGLGLANQVHSVLGDAIKQADFELRWDESGDWESDDDNELTMTEEEMRAYEFERSMAMRRNPIQRHLGDTAKVNG